MALFKFSQLISMSSEFSTISTYIHLNFLILN
jgi:hypothetical protein